MNDLPIREPDQIRQDCARKLQGVQIGDHFQAILGCLLGEDWTTPRLVEMVITPGLFAATGVDVIDLHRGFRNRTC